MDNSISQSVPAMKAVLPSTKMLIKDTFFFAKLHWRMLSLIGLPLFIISVVSQNLNQAFGSISTTNSVIAVGSLIAIVLVAILNLILSLIQPMALARTILSAEKGTILSLQEAFSPSWSSFWSYLWVIILAALVSLITHGFFILPGIFFHVALMFAFFIYLDQDKKGLSALTASLRQIKGYWWAVLGRTALFTLLVGIVFLIVTVIIGLLGGILSATFLQVSSATASILNVISNMLVQFIFLPVYFVFLTKLYQALKSIRGTEVSDMEVKEAKKTLATWTILGLLGWIVVGFLFTTLLVPFAVKNYPSPHGKFPFGNMRYR